MCVFDKFLNTCSDEFPQRLRINTIHDFLLEAWEIQEDGGELDCASPVSNSRGIQYWSTGRGRREEPPLLLERHVRGVYGVSLAIHAVPCITCGTFLHETLVLLLT